MKGPKTGCTSGYIQPETAEDCGFVAEANNVRYNPRGCAKCASDADPKGCIYRTVDKDIYFNAHEIGSTHRNDRQTVCIKGKT